MKADSYVKFHISDNIKFPNICICCNKITTENALEIPILYESYRDKNGKYLVGGLLGLATTGNVWGALGGAEGNATRAKTKIKVTKSLSVRICQSCLLNRPVSQMLNNIIFNMKLNSDSILIRSDNISFLHALSDNNPGSIPNFDQSVYIDNKLTDESSEKKQIDNCWFCEKKQSQDGSEYKPRMYGITSTERTGPNVRWLNLQPSFPRCSECKRLHWKKTRRENLTYMMGSVIGALIFYISSHDHSFLPTLVSIIAGVGIGFSFGYAIIGITRLIYYLKHRTQKQTVKSEKEANKFLENHGWQIGETPPQ